MGAPLIELRNVTKKFGDKTILDNVSLAIPENKICGIIGPSGSGKTTLLNTIMGCLKANRGNVCYKGQDIQSIKQVMKSKVGFASQIHSFYSKLSVKENIEYFGKLYGLNSETIDERRDILLDVMKLKDDEHKLGEELSSGMKKRLDIACSLIHDPEVLILDEPTADLDAVLRGEILNLLKEIKDSGTTVIITSHLLQEVEQLCDNVVLIHNKKAVNLDTQHDNRREVTVRFRSKEYTGFLRSLERMQLPIESSKVEEGSLKVSTIASDAVLQAAISHSVKNSDELEHLNVNKMNLEKMFVDRVKK